MVATTYFNDYSIILRLRAPFAYINISASNLCYTVIYNAILSYNPLEERSMLMNKFYSFCHKFILIIALVLLVYLGVTCIFIYGHLDSSLTEHMEFRRNGIVFFVLLAIFLFALWKLKDLIGKVPARNIVIVCSLIYIVAGLFIALRVPDSLSGDPYMIFKYANRFLEKNYEGLTGNFYLRFFPYQLGMVTLEMGLLSIWNSTRVFFIAFLVFVLGINLVQWQIAELLFDDSRIVSVCTLMSYGFAPMLLFILFVYGSIPGYLFVCLGYYFLIRYFKKKKTVNIVFSALFLGVAVIFKPNYLIAVMAFGIILFMDLIKKPVLRKFIVLVLAVIICLLPNMAFTQMWKSISGVNFDGGAPYLLNVTMGLQPEEMGVGRLGGWYNGYNFSTFTDTECNVEKSNQIAKEGLKEMISYWKSGEDDPVKFFKEKLWSTWCDPLFQSVWSGPLEEAGQRVDDKLLHSLYSDGHVAMAVEKYMNLFMVAVYLFAAVWCFGKIKNKPSDTESLFSLLLFIGALLFHLISETKSQYVFMFAYGLIPYACAGMFRHSS